MCQKGFATNELAEVPKLPPSSHSKELLVVIQVDFTTPIGWLERLQSAISQFSCCSHSVGKC